MSKKDHHNKLVLAIESSCDETACAIIDSKNNVLSSCVASQIKTHAVFGGVVPEIAARAHLQIIDSLVQETLAQAKLNILEIDLLAVTRGPGLIGALLVGISYAKGLALSRNLPLIPVNHVHAHVHGGLITIKDPNFPCIALVASGGHTNVYYMKSVNSFELIAKSIDDACGESFDKVAKMLNLSYPGGPKIEKLAVNGDKTKFKMPIMMESNKKIAFSYSGLKTAIAQILKKTNLTKQDAADLCAAFQHEALSQLIRKLKFIVKSKPEVQSILISGGVAANQYFKDLLLHTFTNKQIYLTPKEYCSDNAVMIAALGLSEYKFMNHEQKQQLYNLEWDGYSRYNYNKQGRNER